MNKPLRCLAFGLGGLGPAMLGLAGAESVPKPTEPHLVIPEVAAWRVVLDPDEKGTGSGNSGLVSPAFQDAVVRRAGDIVNYEITWPGGKQQTQWQRGKILAVQPRENGRVMAIHTRLLSTGSLEYRVVPLLPDSQAKKQYRRTYQNKEGDYVHEYAIKSRPQLSEEGKLVRMPITLEIDAETKFPYSIRDLSGKYYFEKIENASPNLTIPAKFARALDDSVERDKRITVKQRRAYQAQQKAAQP
ncbi:MAG: hypothetical protein AAGK14_04765 [Verrucomicrobiota bacterium]